MLNVPASTALSVLGDVTRRSIFELLSQAPHAVTELAAKLPVSRSAVSQHLKVLKDHGLVSERRAGKQRIYSAVPGAIRHVARYAMELGAGPQPRAEASVFRTEQTDRIDRMLANWPGAAEHAIDAVALSTRLLAIGRIMEKLLARACADYGIAKVDMIILGTLSRLPAPHESAPTELSKIAVLSPPGITKRLDLLEERKLIVRLPGSKDRRTQIIRLTPRGRRVHDDIARHNFAHNYAAIFALPPADREQLNFQLRRLLRDLESRV
jgi:DNA-binding MarR family transcriptional regulator